MHRWSMSVNLSNKRIVCVNEYPDLGMKCLKGRSSPRFQSLWLSLTLSVWRARAVYLLGETVVKLKHLPLSVTFAGGIISVTRSRKGEKKTNTTAD